VLNQIVSFLELADNKMHQFVQKNGMQALRENPEQMGTSVGMLRRATQIMVHISRHDNCRRHFIKLQNRLLQFTVSHFMDSRVAAMIADILFEMQRSENNVLENKSENDIGTAQKESSPFPIRINSAASSLVDDEASRLSTTTTLVLPKMGEDFGVSAVVGNDSSSVSFGTPPQMNGGNHFLKTTESRRSHSPSGYNYDEENNGQTHSLHLHPNNNHDISIQQQHSPSGNHKISAELKEKIRNNIQMKHSDDESSKCNSNCIPLNDKKPKHLLNGAVKINGRRCSPSPNSAVAESGGESNAQSESKNNSNANNSVTASTATQQQSSSGSLTAVA
jgi:hypothetical protein